MSRSTDTGRAAGTAAAFAAGAAAVLTTHQAVLWALHRAGWAPWPAYSLASTRPLGVPAVLSAAFWGGVWWAALDPLARRASTPSGTYARAALLGAVLPNAVGATLAALGRGQASAQSLGDAGRYKAIASAVAINALWAVTAAALRSATAPGTAPRTARR
jgi:hypothetical protein